MDGNWMDGQELVEAAWTVGCGADSPHHDAGGPTFLRLLTIGVEVQMRWL